MVFWSGCFSCRTRRGKGVFEEEMQETAMKPGESASVDGIEVGMMEMRMQLRENLLSRRRALLYMYCMLTPAMSTFFLAPHLLPRSTKNLLMDPGSPTISWLVLGIANDYEPSRDQGTGPDAYGPSPPKSGPGTAVEAWMERRSRHLRRKAAELEALRDEPLIQPRVGSSWADPRRDMERQRPGKLEFMGMEWDGQPVALEEESV